jgi:hypothetical protein
MCLDILESKIDARAFRRTYVILYYILLEIAFNLCHFGEGFLLVQATTTLRCILDRSVDHMPHRSRTLASGEKAVSKVFPATWKWKESIPKLNTMNSAFGLKDVSISNLSKIRKLNFPEYDAKKLGDNFA